MKVILAGYNVDSEVLADLKKKAPSREDVTPETLSASYARISRDPRPVNELRAAARKEVERARRSNRNIIFKMGHHSVAEHAVFNFDIIGVSRLAIEEIEKFRLCSYTEKSQRYITLTDDFVIPEEIKKSGQKDIFVKTVKSQNAAYHKLFKRLRPYFFKKHAKMAKDPKKRSLLEGWAKEDARYVSSLATEGQLGMTVNARNLEFMIRRFASTELAELKEFNQRIYALAKEVAPSIILFTEASDFDAKTYGEIEEKTRAFLGTEAKSTQSVSLVDCTPEADTRLVASFLHTSSFLPYDECLQKAKNLREKEKKELLELAFKRMEFYDFPQREFEYISLTFDLIVSASCFAQLKRHRMATLTSQDYNPELGVTVPPSVEEIGAKKEFMDTIEETNSVYSRLKEKMDVGAEYVLTNAHRKRVLLKVNARELYHIARLREDATAQWDIREVTGEMSRLAREKMPLTCLLLGGKDAYPGMYEKVFGRLPKFFPPE
ncbi:MAG: FAD-dependent thymidylate synthase [Candidatus Aminicenantes bacterium]|nr:MAG: FAD-dependent thymidylate synthase [Candidatus Aminicenantes bacterium]